MRTAFLATTGVSLLLALVVAPASQAMTAVPYGSVAIVHSNKCLSIEGASTVGGARVLQAGCTPADRLQWQVQPNGAYSQLLNRKSGHCLSVTGASTSRAAQLVQTSCATTDSQLLTITALNGGYQIRFKHSNFCADITGADQADGGTAIQWDCSGSANQTFEFEQRAFVQQAPLAIMGTQNGQCVTVPGGSTVAGTNIVQQPCAGAGNDTWSLRPIGQGVSIVGRQSGQCLDVYGISQSSGASVIQWNCSGAANQQWRLQAFGNAWRLVAVHSGQCLRVPGSATTAGTALVQSPCNGDANELWSFRQPTLAAKWSGVTATTVDPVAAANLPNGKLVVWSAEQTLSFNANASGRTYTELIDPVAGSGSVFLVSNTGHDMFCPGTAVLDDGRILVNGGIDNVRTSLYDPVAGTWSSGANMTIGRGYNGTVMTADTTVLTLGGSWKGSPQGNRTGELWARNVGWKVLSGVPATSIQTADSAGPYRSDNHLWLHVLSGGRLLHSGPSRQMNWIDPKANGGQGTITSAGLRGDDPDSINGNAIQYDVDRILKIGGSPNYDSSNATPAARLIDATSRTAAPAVERIAPMAYARAFANSVVLPGGQVVVVGGQTFAVPFSDNNAIFVPELWDPVARVFERLPAMATPRTYHSVALLLPDGRVWVGGGGLCGSCTTNHANYEILTPPHLLNDDGSAAIRPAITRVAQTTPTPGSSIDVTTSTPVKSFALIRLASVTHSVNNDQRRIPLTATTSNGSQYRMTLPGDPGVLVPGYYMLFALNASGVPSVSYTLRIAAS